VVFRTICLLEICLPHITPMLYGYTSHRKELARHHEYYWYEFHVHGLQGSFYWRCCQDIKLDARVMCYLEEPY